MIDTRAARAFALAAVLTAATACDRGHLDPAETGSVPLALELIADASAGGAANAFDRADSMLVRVRVGNRVRYERVVAISAGGSDLRLGIEVPAIGGSGAATLEVELRLGSAPLFRGEAPVTLRIGREARLSVALSPVIARIVLPDSVGPLASYGEQIIVQAAAVFATGDTAEIADVDWSSLDPAIVDVEGGVPVSRGDGLARVIATLDGLSDTTRVRVFAIVRSVVVSPNLTTLDLGQSRPLQALLLDARGNVISGRAVTWLSSDPNIILVTPDGTATGRGVGIARITAQSGEASSTALVETVAGRPGATTRQPDQVTPTTARLHASIASGGVTTQVWFEYAREPSFTERFSTPPQTVTGSSQTVEVSVDLKSLVPNTRYFYRVLARNGVGTSTGEPLTFTTGSGVPSVITDPASGITRAAATLHGRVTSNGAGTAWFEIGPAGDPASLVARQTIALGAGSIQIRIDDDLTGLTPNTTYWFRLVARTSEGQRAGAIRSFTTLADGSVQIAPTVTTLAAGPVRTDSAVANGTVNPNGNATQAWFEYSTDPELDTFSSTAQTSVGNGAAGVALQQLIQGLTPTTTYYVRAAASNGAGTVRGAIVEFTTATPPPVAPTVVTTGSSQVGQTAATLAGSANPRGSATEVWFEYATNPQLTAFSSTPSQDVGAGSSAAAFAEGLTGLTPSTAYWFRAVARNAAGTVRGQILQFATHAPPPTPPAVTTEPASAIGLDEATLHGTVDPNGSATQVWFQYGTDAQLATHSSTTAQSAGAGDAAVAFDALLDALAEGTTYYFRAVAQNTAGTVYGAIRSFTTQSPQPVLPAVSTDSANAIGLDGATLFGTANPNGFATDVWFEYATDDGFSNPIVTSTTAMGSGTTDVKFSRAVTGLTQGTTYYYRAVAQNAAGTVYGTVESLTTAQPQQQPPTVTTQAANPVRADSAVANAQVNPNGAATQAWFEYGTSPTLAAFSSTPNQAVGSGSGAATVQALIQGLQPGTTYYVRAAASNTGGTTKGAIVSFTTQAPAAPPTVATAAASSIGNAGATLNGTVNPNGSATSVWFEWSTNVNFTGATPTTAHPAGSASSTSPFSQAITGLIPGVTYWFRAVAQNTNGADVGEAMSFTTTTPNPGPPSVTTDSARYTDVYNSEVLMFGTAIPNGNPTEGWFELGLLDIDGNFVVVDSSTTKQQLGAGFGPVHFQDFRDENGAWGEQSAALAASTMLPVRIRAVARNSAGTVYGLPFEPAPYGEVNSESIGVAPGYRPATPTRRPAPGSTTQRRTGGGTL